MGAASPHPSPATSLSRPVIPAAGSACPMLALMPLTASCPSTASSPDASTAPTSDPASIGSPSAVPVPCASPSVSSHAPTPASTHAAMSSPC
eukprot:5077212-Prymnesium_polylepis.2